MSKLTLKKRRRALELIRSGELVIDVADSIGVSRQALYALRKTDPDFAKEWDEAVDIGARIQLGELEKEADFRGRIGWLEPKFYEGRICGYIPRFSDGLLMARIKAQAKRIGDDSYIDRIDQTSNGETVQAGLVVVRKADKDEEEWHGDHSKR